MLAVRATSDPEFAQFPHHFLYTAGCPELQELFEKSKKTSSLEKICEAFEAKVNIENLSEKDRPLLEAYKKSAREFENAAEGYHEESAHYVNSRKLDLVLHHKSKGEHARKIDPKDIDEYLNSSDLPITLNCHSCNQQVDVFAELELSKRP